MCDSLNETYDNRDDSAALAIKSKLSANRSVPIPRKTSVRSKMEVTSSFLATIFDVSSESHRIVMSLCPSGIVSLSAAARTVCASRVRKDFWHARQFGMPKAFSRISPREKLIPDSRKEIM